MVQVHVPAKEWGFDSPLGHHIPFGCERVNIPEKPNRDKLTPLLPGFLQLAVSLDPATPP